MVWTIPICASGLDAWNTSQVNGADFRENFYLNLVDGQLQRLAVSGPDRM